MYSETGQIGGVCLPDPSGEGNPPQSGRGRRPREKRERNLLTQPAFVQNNPCRYISNVNATSNAQLLHIHVSREQIRSAQISVQSQSVCLQCYFFNLINLFAIFQNRKTITKRLLYIILISQAVAITAFIFLAIVIINNNTEAQSLGLAFLARRRATRDAWHDRRWPSSCEIPFRS